MNTFIGFFVGIWTAFATALGFAAPQAPLPVIDDMPTGTEQTVSPDQAKAYIDQINASAKDQKKPATSESNWKTYTNTQYGFSFNYPSNTVVTFVDHVPPHGTDLMLPDDEKNPDKTKSNYIEKDGTVGDVLRFMVFHSTTKNLDAYFSRTCNEIASAKCSTTKINGQTAYQIRYDNGITRVHMQNSRHTFIFQYTPENISNTQIILSTLTVFDVLSEMPIEVTCTDTDTCLVPIWDTQNRAMSIMVPKQFAPITKLTVTSDASPKLPGLAGEPRPLDVDGAEWHVVGAGDAGCSNMWYYRTTPGFAQTVYIVFSTCEGQGYILPTDNEVRQMIRTLAKG